MLVPLLVTWCQKLKSFESNDAQKSETGVSVQETGAKDNESRLPNLRRDPLALSTDRNLSPAVSDVCLGNHVSVRQRRSYTDELFLSPRQRLAPGAEQRQYLKAD